MPSTEQSTLFPQLAPAPPVTGELFAQVVFNRPLDRPFTYVVPDAMAATIAIGKRVLAPFGRGNKPAAGYCVEVSDHPPEYAVKPLLRILDDEPLLTPALM